MTTKKYKKDKVDICGVCYHPRRVHIEKGTLCIECQKLSYGIIEDVFKHVNPEMAANPKIREIAWSLAEELGSGPLCVGFEEIDNLALLKHLERNKCKEKNDKNS